MARARRPAVGQRPEDGQSIRARWLDAARECGLPVTDDFNGAEQEGVGIYQ